MTTDATQIRDEIVDRLATLPGYASAPRKVPLPQQQPGDLPQISVFIMSERLAPDGDSNAGEPSFVSDITIGISDMRGFDTPEVLDGQNDAAVDAIETALLTDPTFVRAGPDALFEAVSGITRRRLYPQDGETYFAELRLEIVFTTRVDFPPSVPDDFDDVTITARPAGSGAHTPPVTVHLDSPDT